MISLTVVTLTRSLETKTLERCKQSVQAALVPGVKHEILVCPKEEFHTRMRYETMLMDDYTTIVDDDDTIDPKSLSRCVDIIARNELDLLFTDEVVRLESDGSVFDSVRGKRAYASVIASPLTIHNLCVLKSKAIDPEALKIALQYGIGIEWLIRSSVALKGKVGHLAEPLYTWYQHPGQHSKTFMKKFNSCFPGLRSSIADTWGQRSGYIDQYS